ncbi:putative ABC transport system ATP-binding protein [Breoghania corrubedonensis]|uniref:Putative ABC transport system ATP-binding protein n=1 Tax=Breoghania corrubedonensis TaxID=665038 RepID=A0A2T5VAC7_9HYPH|nr:ATP-binding cassette domain-containing protein [Breoghania corrubedonensis]PTW60684.1 putative ABC transport system ATP-binding protein [Breoghania corrubedonensis]
MFTIENLVLSYRDDGGKPFTVLELPALQLGRESLVVVTGPSGSGKSSLLYALCGLLKPTAGAVRHEGQDIYALSEARRDRWRRETVGLIFQDFHLIPELSPLANVTLATHFGGTADRRALALRGRALLDVLGVPTDRRHASALSRGEQQRTAIARALLFDPPAILADEPTASLDAEASTLVADRLLSLSRDEGRLVLAVSHDPILISRADRLLHLERGHLKETEPTMRKEIPA